MFFDQKNYSDKIALVDVDRTQYTYGSLCKTAKELYSCVPSRSLMFIICDNDLESIIAYAGAIDFGVVPLMINHKVDGSLLEKLRDLYQPQFVFCKKNVADYFFGEKVFEYKEYILIEQKVKSIEMYQDLALLLTTSGSTGSPKCVRQSYENIFENAKSIKEYLGIVESDVAIMTMPMSYTYCLSIINSHLISGATIQINRYSFFEKDFWELCKKSNVTNFGGVPYLYEMLLAIGFEKIDIPRLRYITQAGGKLSSELAKEFVRISKEKNIKFIIMYGQTEATARMSYLPWESAEAKPSSIGIAIPSGRLTVRDSESQILPVGETGELVYEGANVTLGYAECADDLALGDFNHGILHTGDMAYCDEDGYFYIVGRKKRFVKIYGNRVSLDEVESILKNHGFSCACTGVDNEIVIFTESDDEDNIRNLLVDVLKFPGQIYDIRHIDVIPRNESGKILYKELGGI